MRRHDEREMDGLLKVALGGATARGSAGPCPDAEELAAYFERSLDAASMTRCEAHVASCLGCQERLAALVRSEPVPVPAARPSLAWLWSPRSLAWATPALIGVIAVTVWLASRPGRLPEQTMQMAARSAPEQPPLPPLQREVIEEPELKLPPEPPAASARAKGGAVARNEAVARMAEAPSQVAPVAVPPPASEAMRAREPAALAKEQAPPPFEEAKAKQAPLPVKEQAARPLDAARAKEAAPLATGQAAAPQVQASERVADTAITPRKPGAAASGLAAIGATRPGARTIAAPGGRLMWRLGPGGQIARSIDGGRSWQAWMTADAELLAGSAPSDTVCWMVGRAGTVLRTHDGQQWNHVASPVSLDLVGIDAVDAQNATVTAADGSRYVTGDGGKTWQRE